LVKLVSTAFPPWPILLTIDPFLGILEIAVNHAGKINTERQYRYKGTSGHACKAKDSIAVSANITGYANVTSGNETALQEAIYKYPVISVGIDASQFSFQM
jgi:hypothetical protein